MKSKSKHPPLYLIIIVLFSTIIGFIVYIQVDNEFYSPQHRSCSNIDFTIRACSTDVDVRFDFQNSMDGVLTLVRINNQLVGEMEVARPLSTRVDISESYEINPSLQDHSCSRESSTIFHEDIARC